MKVLSVITVLLGTLATVAEQPGNGEVSATEQPLPLTGNAAAGAGETETAPGTLARDNSPSEIPAPAAGLFSARWPAAAVGGRPPLWQYDTLDGRLSLGTRVLRLNLKRNRQGEPFDGSFIGSINKLEAVEDRRANRPFIQFAVLPYLGIGVQQDRLEIKTLTTIPRAQRYDDRNTDGNVIMRGVLSYVFARLPNRTICTPFVEYGEARYHNRFDPDPDWYAGGHRQFILDPVSKATYRGAGLEFELGSHVSLDLYYREMDIDVPGEYHFRGDGRPPAPFVFTMKHSACGIGARVLF